MSDTPLAEDYLNLGGVAELGIPDVYDTNSSGSDSIEQAQFTTVDIYESKPVNQFRSLRRVSEGWFSIVS